MEGFRDWLIGRSVRKHGRRPSEATLHGKVGRVANVINIAGAESPKALARILADRTQVEHLLDKLYARLQPQTVRGYLLTLRDFGDYAIASGWTEACEIRATDVPRLGPQKAFSVYSDAELDLLRLFARARGNFRFWVLVETLIDTGRRISETLAIRWVDVKLDADPPHFDLPTTKNLRQQYVPLTKRLREEVWTPDAVSSLRSDDRTTRREGAAAAVSVGLRDGAADVPSAMRGHRSRIPRLPLPAAYERNGDACSWRPYPSGECAPRPRERRDNRPHLQPRDRAQLRPLH